MKIIHIIYDSFNNPWLNGGGAKRTQALYEQLVKKHDITVLCGNYSGARSKINGVNYKHIGLKNNYAVSRLTFVIFAWIYILTHKADVWVEDIGFPFPLFVTLFKKNNYGSVQFLPNNTYANKRGLVGKITQFGFEHGLKFYKNIITVSQFAANSFRKYTPKSEILILENGVKKVKTQPNKPEYFLYIGRIDLYGKGLDILLDAIKIIVDTDRNFKFVIAGDGEKKDKTALRIIIKNNNLSKYIKLTGYVNDDKKPELFSKAIAIVLPSRNETSSISALEAFSFGRPVIGSDVGGLGEILTKSKAGILFKNENAKELSKAILKLKYEDQLVNELSSQGSEYIKNYTWDKLAYKYESILIGGNNT